MASNYENTGSLRTQTFGAAHSVKRSVPQEFGGFLESVSCGG